VWWASCGRLPGNNQQAATAVGNEEGDVVNKRGNNEIDVLTLMY